MDTHLKLISLVSQELNSMRRSLGIKLALVAHYNLFGQREFYMLVHIMRQSSLHSIKCSESLNGLWQSILLGSGVLQDIKVLIV